VVDLKPDVVCEYWGENNFS